MPNCQRAYQGIHTRFGAKTKNILHGHDDRARGRAVKTANKVPMNIRAIGAEVIKRNLTLTSISSALRASLPRFTGEPTDHGIVIMRAGIGDAVSYIFFW